MDLSAASSVAAAPSAGTLSRWLRQSRTATQGLLAWCEACGLASGPILAVRRTDAPDLPLDLPGMAALAAGPGETVRHRRVELMRGKLALALADNWYIPSRLPQALQAQLAETNLPFGTVVAPLDPSRRTLLARLADEDLLPPGFVAEHHAVVLDGQGRPLAFVRERYRAVLLGA